MIKFSFKDFQKFHRLIIVFLSATLLSGCLMDFGTAHKKPIPESTVQLMKAKNIKYGSKMLVRIFKEENQLELWMKNRANKFVLLKKYDICKWSGTFGPKTKTGDRQAPEGFYSVNKWQMHPRSKYHLAFNIGYPNKYDRSYGRTGAHLMVHGDCDSAGCYAMSDANIEEIYALAREAFKYGQKSFQVHAFPFKMTEANMNRFKGHIWYKFWRNIKVGYDLFEKQRDDFSVGVLNKKYVFNFDHNKTQDTTANAGDGSILSVLYPTIIAKPSG